MKIFIRLWFLWMLLSVFGGHPLVAIAQSSPSRSRNATKLRESARKSQKQHSKFEKMLEAHPTPSYLTEVRPLDAWDPNKKSAHIDAVTRHSEPIELISQSGLRRGLRQPEEYAQPTGKKAAGWLLLMYGSQQKHDLLLAPGLCRRKRQLAARTVKGYRAPHRSGPP